MLDLHSPPTLPLTGFALYSNNRLLLQGGTPARCSFSQPDQLTADAYQQLLWLLEIALGAQRNELAQTDPSSIRSLLRVITFCHANRERDRFTGAVLALGIKPLSPLPASYAQSPRGGVCKPVACLVPRDALPSRTHVAGVECLGRLPEAGRPAVA
jgi:hypothetical protein